MIFGYATLADAQTGSVYWAGGTATDSSAGPVDTLGGGVIYNSPRMGGFFETVGADVILWHNLGVGGEFSFRNGDGAYAGLTYHPAFYDINAVYQPLKLAHRITPEFQGGFGRFNLQYYYTPAFCLTYPEGCRSTTAEATGRSHLQLHVSGGVRFYVFKRLFVRPQLDVHWVDKLPDFGSPWVPEYSVALGYTLSRGH